MSKASIIVRTMGRPELKRALSSLTAQTYPEMEIVLVIANPDWQPDPEFCRDNVVLVTPGKKLLRPDAANAGLTAARGAWIGFLDEDDWVEPNHVENLMAVANTAQSARVVYGDLVVHEGVRNYVRSVGYWRRRQADSPIPHINSFLLARSLYEQDRCHFDPAFELLEDWDFFVQCAEYSDFIHVKKASAHYAADLGNSGGGFGVNRDNKRLQPYIDKMSTKWGYRYGELIEAADQALAQGRVAHTKGDWQYAETRALSGLALDPGHPYLLNLLASCRWQTGDPMGSLNALRRACDSAPDNFTLHFDLTAMEHRFGNKEHTREALASAWKLGEGAEQRTRVEALAKQLGLNVPAD